MNTVISFVYRDGSQAYAIQDGSTKLYFIWCYSNEAFANLMADSVHITDALDQQVNWRADKAMLVMSDRVQL